MCFFSVTVHTEYFSLRLHEDLSRKTLSLYRCIVKAIGRTIGVSRRVSLFGLTHPLKKWEPTMASRRARSYTAHEWRGVSPRARSLFLARVFLSRGRARACMHTRRDCEGAKSFFPRSIDRARKRLYTRRMPDNPKSDASYGYMS